MLFVTLLGMNQLNSGGLCRVRWAAGFAGPSGAASVHAAEQPALANRSATAAGEEESAAAAREIDARRLRHPPYKALPSIAKPTDFLLLSCSPPPSPTERRMSGERCVGRPLFGGAVSSTFPVRFQEVFVDPARDESLIFELLDLKGEVEDGGSALWFLRDIANEQEAGDSLVVEHSGTIELGGLRFGDAPAVAGTAVGQLAISKGRQSREAQNIVRLYLANIRLKNAATDVVITVYEPLLINPLSESARAVAAGPAVPAEQAGCLPMSEIFKLAVMNFNVHDWNLFNGST
uniref:Ran guanine nucleotide release factor n=1 Tax=Oryza punctata TaxID=4537 RepID=A0A0E0KRF6_ORYPU